MTRTEMLDKLEEARKHLAIADEVGRKGNTGATLGALLAAAERHEAVLRALVERLGNEDP